MSASGRMHFVCSVGISQYTECAYAYNGGTCTTRFAPVAVAHLCQLQGARASVLATKEAHDRWYAPVRDELTQQGLDVQPVLIPLGATADELETILASFVEVVGEGEEVVLDVTNALRHLPFAFLAALTYLTAYRRVTIKGIYFAAYEARDQVTNVAPILNLTPLFDLTRWYHALQTANESGDLRQVAKLVDEEARPKLPGDRVPSDALARVRDGLKKLAPALTAGLPVEAGVHAAQVEAALRILSDSYGSRPLHLTFGPLQEWVARFARSATAPKKAMVRLTVDELKRQLRLVQWYAERSDVPRAALILREWMVSLCVLARGDTDRWMSYEQRSSRERYLNALKERKKIIEISDYERAVTSVWQSLRELRNRFAHVGMTDDEVTVGQGETSKLAGAAQTCERLLNRLHEWQGTTPSAGVLLVTPLGFSPGVVFTTLRLVKPRPEQLLVVTSSKAQEKLPEALQQAEAEHIAVKLLLMGDPHTGYTQVAALLTNDVRRWLAEATKVVVNLSGGTTVMQAAVERVARTAESLGTPVQRIAAVDQRSREEQQENPYVEGTIFPFDAEEEAEDVGE